MAITLNDSEIQKLINEQKELPEDFEKHLSLKPKRGHKEAEIDIKGNLGSEFKIIARQSNFNPLDFSIIFAYQIPKSNTIFRIRRYNGKSHEHTNKIESNTFDSFHIHQATERYQELGMREDSFAEPSTKFADFRSALNILFSECNFRRKKGNQESLFREEDSI